MESKCPNCGHELPEGAAFCPYCETSLVEKTPVDLPRPHSRRLLLLLLAAAVLLAGVLLTVPRLFRASKVYDAQGPEIVYPGRSGEVRLFLCLPVYPSIQPVDFVENSIPEGMNYAYPSLLFLDTKDPQAFWDENVEAVSVECVPRDGADAMAFSEPSSDPQFPEAFLTSNINYNTRCGTNDVVWELRMKNGDTVRLSQTISILLQQKEVYTPENTALDTADDLAALLERIEAESPGDASVEIYLPPAVYDRPIEFVNRTVSLFGSEDPATGRRTTFTETLSVFTGSPSPCTLAGLQFSVENGTGVYLTTGAALTDCEFTGCNVGLWAAEGGWGIASGCTFSQNGVGYRIDTRKVTLFNDVLSDNTYADNGVGLEILNFPANGLFLPGNRFSGNGTDIVRQTDFDLNTEEAVFE